MSIVALHAEQGTNIVYRFFYMSKQHQLHIATPGGNHEGGNRGQQEAYKDGIYISDQQTFVVDPLRTVMAKDTAAIPDAVIGIHTIVPIIDAVERGYGDVRLTQDIIVIQTAASETTPHVVGSVSSCSLKCSTMLNMCSSSA